VEAWNKCEKKYVNDVTLPEVVEGEDDLEGWNSWNLELFVIGHMCWFPLILFSQAVMTINNK